MQCGSRPKEEPIMDKEHKELIESLEEEMMEAWSSSSRGEGLLEGLGNGMRIQGRAYYEADKRKIMRKKKWDKDCNAFVAKMRKEIRNG